MLRKLQSALCRNRSLVIFEKLSHLEHPRRPDLFFRATISSSSKCLSTAEIVDHQKSTTITQETNDESIANNLRNPLLEESNVFLDDQTLHMEKRIRLNREEMAKQRKFQSECLRKVMDIADGKMDFEPLGLNILYESLKLGLILNKQSFLVMYYETWWRIFEASIEKLGSQLENLSSNENSSLEIVNALEEIIAKLGVLNSHTNGLMRSIMQHSHIRFLQILVARILPIASTKFIQKLCESLQNLYMLEDAKSSWEFLSENFTSKLIDRLKQLQLDLSLMTDADQKLFVVDVHSCIARVAKTLILINCRVEKDQKKFLVENCSKITNIINEQCPELLNFNRHDLAAFIGHLRAACVGQMSAAHVISMWGDEDQLKGENFWRSWLTSSAFLIEKAEKLPSSTESSDVRKSDFHGFWTIISRLCSTIVFTSIRTKNMDKFDEMRQVWSTCFERSLPSLSYARVRNLYNETFVAEFDLLKDVSLKTIDTKIINSDIRAKLLEKTLAGKELRLSPYLKHLRSNDEEKYDHDNNIKNRLSGRKFDAGRAGMTTERTPHINRYNRRKEFGGATGGDDFGNFYGDKRYERFDNRKQGGSRHFGRPSFDAFDEDEHYREETSSRFNAQNRESSRRFDRDNSDTMQQGRTFVQKRESSRRFDRDNSDTMPQGQKMERYNRPEIEDDYAQDQNPRRQNSWRSENFVDESDEFKENDQNIDISSKAPSFRRKMRMTQEKIVNSDREKRGERIRSDPLDDFEGDDDFGALAPKSRRRQQTSARHGSNRKQLEEDDSEFV